ncbi:MAG: tRNA pseudouridine(13) synthase TruD [Acidilobaceae archaeon]|nr:tRNA pseudouridine(13) synthase TruD [Acidilobaceae archaeon]
MISELLMGLEARLYSLERPRAVLRLPEGFRVVELRPPGEGEHYLYLVRKVGVSTERALRLLSRYIRKGSHAGLKDAHSISYQYLSTPYPGPSFIDLGSVKAWLVGQGAKLKRGSHGGNLFRIALESEGAELLEKNLRAIREVPAFYGPQRFGRRLTTHLYGLAIARGDPGALAREFKRGLSFERRLLQEARERRDPWLLLRRAERIYSEALQAYLFNRALSRVIREGELAEVGERALEVRACSSSARLPAVRLPYEGLKGTRWADVVRQVMEEEGITRGELRRVKGELRPLYYLAQIRSVAREGNRVSFTLCLPPGAYATALLREVAEVVREPSQE